MINTCLLLLPAILFGSCLSQHSVLLGTMYDIPAKIHSEIFGSNARPVMNLEDLNRQSYMISPLQTQKRSLSTGLTYNSVAYGFGHYQMPRSNNSMTVDRIPLATELFAPAIVKFPAATKGQVEAYMKALEEEVKEAEKEMQMQLLMQTKAVLDKERAIIDPNAISYVNVKLGGVQNVNYHYSSA